MTTAALALITAMRARRAGAGSPPPTDGLQPSWMAEYVDPNGVTRRTTIENDGSTVITIRRYANVTFDGSASRSSSAGCGTAQGAAQLMGFGINYGENLGGNWGTSGLPRDTDQGPPLFHRCYSVTGARTVFLYIRDPDGRESTVTLTVNVQSLGEIIDISAGSTWPTWEDGAVYGLTGDNYMARGPLATPGRYGIRIVKLGDGPNPQIAQFRPETRGVNHGSLVTDRSRDIVLVGIDYTRFENGVVGSDYCGSYGGNCQSYGEGSTHPMRYVWENEGIIPGNRTNADNVRFARGLFVVDGGAVGAEASWNGHYCFIGGGRSFNFAGTSFVRTTGAENGNPMRTYLDRTVLRHIQIYSTTPTFSFIKGSFYPCVYAAMPSDPWPDDDSFGDYDTSRGLYLANGAAGTGNWGVGGSYFWVCDSVFGGPGTFQPVFIGGLNPQNDDPPSNGQDGPWENEDCFESGYTSGFENNRLTYNSAAALTLSGRGFSHRGNVQLNGSAWNVTTNSNPNRTHPDYLGPYYTNPRPVHPAFA